MGCEGVLVSSAASMTARAQVAPVSFVCLRFRPDEDEWFRGCVTKHVSGNCIEVHYGVVQRNVG